MSDNQLQPIPQPPDKPIVGNLFDLSGSNGVQDLMRLAEDYGGIFFLQIGGHRNIIVSDPDLVEELSDESRFDKRVWAPLKNVRTFAGDGLFTAHTFEPNWKKAHNVLLPNFSMAAMNRYHPMMIDIARQMIDKWSRLNPGDSVSVSDEMTGLTLDTIGLCGFGYRFNSFYRERPHPFIRAMTQALGTAMDRTNRLGIFDKVQFVENKRFDTATKLMNDTVDGIIAERRKNPEGLEGKADLLSAMMTGTDRETGEGLDDLNIRYQIITFLIAGHETTSGLLSFTIYFLLQNPEVLQRAREEVDRVLGRNIHADPTYRQVTELRYVKQILHESLRLWPTAPMYALFPIEGETVLGGKYEISKRDGLAVLVPMLHRNKKIWGENADQFDPEHFAPEAERQRPPNAFKPFGNGQRACIGRQFAMHEATLAIGMILQRFDLVGPDDYDLKVKETLTLKPKGLSIKLSPRKQGASKSSDIGQDESSVAAASPAPQKKEGPARLPAHGTPLQVLFGSNMGTAEGLATRIGEAGEQRGFAVSVEPLDHAVGKLNRKGLVVIVTASYNGTPPDNAVRFANWLDAGELDSESFAGVRYTVFGCGHHDWVATYQSVPTKFDKQLKEYGGDRFHQRGEGNAGDDFESDYESWFDGFWESAQQTMGIDLRIDAKQTDDQVADVPYQVEIVPDRNPNPFVNSFHARPLMVIENQELQTSKSDRSTRHIELDLPSDLTYNTGDHLGVIARNHPSLVQRALDRFAFDSETRIRVRARSEGQVIFPADEPISVKELLSDYVELQEPATRGQIKQLLQYTRCPPERPPLEALCGDDEASRLRYREQVLQRRLSVLDLLETSPASELPFGVFLGMLPALRPRYYSISSSPMYATGPLSITVGVLESPARSGKGTYYGSCSTHLASKQPGQLIHAFVRGNRSNFFPPRDPMTPMIMVGPGTGIAPFRGFLQERAAWLRRGERVGPAMLFFGCRHPDQDDLYRDEMNNFAKSKVVEIQTAYSRAGAKVYVQDRIGQSADRVWELIRANAVIYVCGDAGVMEPAVRETFGKLYQQKTGKGAEEATAWLNELVQQNRYLVDVWASS